MKKNIVYLIGAGASTSISPQDIPVMNNFFEKALNLKLINDININTGILTSLVDADINNLLSPDINRNLLAQQLQESMTPPNTGEINLTTLKKYKNIFLENIKNKQNDFNLEKIFTKAWDTQEYQRLLFLINAVFRELDGKISQQFNQAAHHKLSRLIAENSDKYNHTFISYNYDIWLEKALFENKLWYPNTGNGIDCNIEKYCKAPEYNKLGGAYNVPSIAKFNVKNNSVTTVLKPHGSLSWVWPIGNKQDSDTIVILKEFNETACIDYSKEWNIPLANGNGSHELQIVPPVDNKNEFVKSDFFQKIENNRNYAISQADIIVTIGYSMPDTDNNIQEELKNLSKRVKQVIICDKQDTDNEKMKLEKKFCYIFQPENNNIYGHYTGFNNEFIEKLKNILK